MNGIACRQCGAQNAPGQSACTRCGAALPKPPAGPGGKRSGAFGAGQVIANRYTVLKLIGRGGMGSIYMVNDNVLKERVALKTLLPQFARDKAVVERFYNEARIARQLSHPAIVRVHDIGMAGQLLYLSMELLPGKSLRQMLDDLPEDEYLPLPLTLHLIDELCGALEYAHRYTIHRDIKPENIMVLPDHHVKLMDFGISKLMAHTKLTATAMVMGTPHYMAPEQFKDSASVDQRADIYSLGVVLYEALTGRTPAGIIKPVAELRPDVPAELDEVIGRCVDAVPADRYGSVAELRKALEPIRARVQGGLSFSPDLLELPGRKPAAALPPASGERPAWLKRALGAVALLAIAGLAVAGLARVEALRQNGPAQAAAGPAAGAATDAGAAAGAAGRPNVRQAVQRVRERAMTFSSDPRWARIIQIGEDHRLAAQDAAGSRPREAAAHARAAMDCFMAPLVWQVKLNQTGDMVFVPPGAVQTPAGPQLVRGFFMDRHEVTLGAFAEFVRQANWRSLNAAGAPDLPAFNVTFYDAQAYAAHQGKRLPTDAQWSLAASYGLGQPEEGGDAGGQGGAYGRQDAILPPGSRPGDVISQLGLADMAGNVAEWTRTTAGPATEGAEPWFGVPMVVRGAWGEPGGPQALQERRQMEYGASHTGLGFRCVYNLPDPARAVDDLLAR